MIKWFFSCSYAGMFELQLKHVQNIPIIILTRSIRYTFLSQYQFIRNLSSILGKSSHTHENQISMMFTYRILSAYFFCHCLQSICMRPWFQHTPISDLKSKRTKRNETTTINREKICVTTTSRHFISICWIWPWLFRCHFQSRIFVRKKFSLLSCLFRSALEHVYTCIFYSYWYD